MQRKLHRQAGEYMSALIYADILQAFNIPELKLRRQYTIRKRENNNGIKRDQKRRGSDPQKSM